MEGGRDIAAEEYKVQKSVARTQMCAFVKKWFIF